MPRHKIFCQDVITLEQLVPLPPQVLWSYGQRCNDDFFVYHGFCLHPNPDEDVALFPGRFLGEGLWF